MILITVLRSKEATVNELTNEINIAIRAGQTFFVWPDLLLRKDPFKRANILHRDAPHALTTHFANTK